MENNNEYKVGDVLHVYSDPKDLGYLLLIEHIDHINCQGTIVDDTKFPQYTGQKFNYSHRYIKDILNAGVLKIDSFNTASNTCKCPIFDLMSRGCKCGGV